MGGPQKQLKHKSAPKKDKGETRQRRRILISLFVFFFLSSLIIAALAFFKGYPEVELQLNVSRFSFQVNDSAIADLFNSIPTQSLRLRNFQKVQLSPGILEKADDVAPATNNPKKWKLLAGGDPEPYAISPTGGQRFASISLKGVTLNHLSLIPGSLVTIEWIESEPNTFKMTVNQRVEGEIAAPEKFRLSCDFCKIDDLPDTSESKTLQITSTNGGGQVVRFSGNDDLIIIGFELLPSAEIKERNILIGSEASFTQQQASRLLSAIKGGRITIQDMKDPIEVTDGDFIQLEDSKDLRVKTIKISNGINITLHGSMSKLLMGASPDNLKDRLPSMLQRLHNREIIMLVIAAFGSIITGLKSIWDWFKDN